LEKGVYMRAEAVASQGQVQQPDSSRDQVLNLVQFALFLTWVAGAIWYSREAKLAPKLMFSVALPLQVAITCIRCCCVGQNSFVAGFRRQFAHQQAQSARQARERVLGENLRDLVINVDVNATLVEDAASRLTDDRREPALALARDMRAHVEKVDGARRNYLEHAIAFPAQELQDEAIAHNERRKAIWPNGMETSQSREDVLPSIRLKYASAELQRGMPQLVANLNAIANM
jgi:hypothetical protein